MFPPQAVAPPPPPPQQQQGAPRKSRGKWYALGGLVVIGAIVTIAVVASRDKKKHEGTNELWIETLEVAHDSVCACKDEPCVREALQRMDSMHKGLEDNLKLTSADEEKQHKLLDQIGECVKRVPGTDQAPGQSARQARDEAAWSKFRDATCACHDRACAKAVLGEVEKYVDANEGQPDAAPTPKLKAIMKEQEKCLQRIVSGGDSHKAPVFKDVMEELGEMRDKMCKCPGSRDPYCAAQVKADFQSTISKSKELLGDSSLGADDQKTLQAGIVQILACEESAKKAGN